MVHYYYLKNNNTYLRNMYINVNNKNWYRFNINIHFQRCGPLSVHVWYMYDYLPTFTIKINRTSLSPPPQKKSTYQAPKISSFAPKRKKFPPFQVNENYRFPRTFASSHCEMDPTWHPRMGKSSGFYISQTFWLGGGGGANQWFVFFCPKIIWLNLRVEWFCMNHKFQEAVTKNTEIGCDFWGRVYCRDVCYPVGCW